MVPGPGQHTNAKWHVSGWSLRAKVSVVLMLPAVVALVLGGARVQDRLDEASRLSAVRDQVGVLRESAALSDLVIAEMLASVSPGGTDLDARRSAVDRSATTIRQAADFTRLPADVGRILSDALGRLGAMRLQATGPTADPITRITGYREILNGLGDLIPGIVSVARTDELDRTARSVMSLVRLRAALATEEALVRLGGANPAAIAAAQRVAAEEAFLASQIQRDIPPQYAGRLTPATSSTQARRDALAGTGPIQADTLLPELTAESTALDGLRGELIDTLSGSVTARTNQARSDALRDAAIVLGALLAALAIALIVARSLLSPVRTLRAAALAAAHHQLPETVERVRAGEPVDWRSIEPVPVRTGEEIGQLARAFDDMHTQAVRLAGEQAELRHQISEMFTTLSRRSQSLVELQLEVIEELEADEQNPKRLDGLFRLDHLATRLRRNGENLQVLAGGSPARPGQGPVGVVELLRAATSEVTDYRRVSLGHAPNGSVRGSAAADVVHILAELLENATRYSPPKHKVVLTADRGAGGGLLIEVIDAGLGMAADDLAAANGLLASSTEVGPQTTRRMGLFVVSRLAERHGVTVRLRPTYDGAKDAGITASVHVPATLIIADHTPEPVRLPAAREEQPVRVERRAPVEQPAPVEPPTRNWFVAQTEAEPVTPPVRTVSPRVAAAEKLWQAASLATATPAPQPAPVTEAGLPRRKPGARVLPTGPSGDQRPGFRDPESIRSNLSRHYDGVRAARQQTQTKSEPREGP